MKPVCYCVIVLALAMVCSPSALAQDADETFGCEANPTGNPIGGGEGYSDIVTTGDYTVTNLDELLAALNEAGPGQVVFVPDGVEIDVTAYRSIKIPEGVTLAGTRGLNGSDGARIFSRPKWGDQFVAAGDEVRLTGLRFEGPFPGPERASLNATFVRTRHFATEIDNCEIYNWNQSGIAIETGAFGVRLHHNYIHHCQRGGLGYGVVISAANAHIIANKFDYCRHHVAATGQPGCCYEAAWNLIMPNCTSYCLDMHGGADRGDSTDIGGDWILIHHNTFQGKQRAVGIYGVPSQGAQVHHNWFALPVEKTVFSRGNTRIYDNVYGPDRTKQEKPIEL